MKKILSVLALLLVVNSCYAAEIDRKIAKDTTNMYVVDYNKHTALSYIGVSNDKWAKGSYAQAAFSCQLKPLNNGQDTLITMRKHSYQGGIFGISTFNHYKKVYRELKFNGVELEKSKK